MQVPRNWKDVAIGVSILLIAWTIGWTASDYVTIHSKVVNLPDISDIVTSKSIDERFKSTNDKIDRNFDVNTKRLDQIEGKIDKLLLSMAIKQRQPSIKNDDSIYPSDLPSIISPKKEHTKVAQVPKE